MHTTQTISPKCSLLLETHSAMMKIQAPISLYRNRRLHFYLVQAPNRLHIGYEAYTSQTSVVSWYTSPESETANILQKGSIHSTVRAQGGTELYWVGNRLGGDPRNSDAPLDVRQNPVPSYLEQYTP